VSRPLAVIWFGAILNTWPCAGVSTITPGSTHWSVWGSSTKFSSFPGKLAMLTTTRVEQNMSAELHLVLGGGAASPPAAQHSSSTATASGVTSLFHIFLSVTLHFLQPSDGLGRPPLRHVHRSQRAHTNSSLFPLNLIL
jgi:hypothetical protein